MRRVLAFVLVLVAGLILGATGPEVFKSSIYIGNTSTYIQRNGADLKFVDGSNPSGKTLTQLAATGSGSGGGVPGAGALRAFNDATNPNSQLGVTAEWLSMVSEDKSTTVLATTVSVTFNIATDLDTGVSESADTFYYCWLSSTDGTNFTRKMTTSAGDVADVLATTPRLRVATILNDASSNFRQLRKTGTRVEYEKSYTNVLNTTASTSGWASVSLTAYIPAIATRGHGTWMYLFNTSAASTTGGVVFSADNVGSSSVLQNTSTQSSIGYIHITGPSGINTFEFEECRGYWDFNFRVDRTAYYSTTTTINGVAMLWVGGWYEDVGF